MTAYKDRSVLSIVPTKNFQDNGVRESLITMSSHTGTHIDAPAHFLAEGATSEHITFDATIGPCTVLDMTHCEQVITVDDLSKVKAHLRKGARLLFKTRNSLRSTTDSFDSEFVYINKEAALYLAQHAVQTVGIDYLGIERDQKEHDTHITLMHANVVIVEGLRLADVMPGDYFLYCLPLALVGIDGAPARAVLIQQ